ncbi:rho GTPase-activating protein 18 isoform X2 [Syngnathoides biaculeatus]|uniref:rho GTPase-activating protein 18 isoform X2 n=1 Tax=Syngnathoides biaculeatus TaxID=300417 RepID=UPI002ADE80A4|nr:rho GTPase-activating protein 18 isoform X2 [Syngnathoides biaculeatus]
MPMNGIQKIFHRNAGAGVPSPFDHLEQHMEDIVGNGGVLKEMIRPGDGPLVPPNASVIMHYAGYLEYADLPFETTMDVKHPGLLKLGQDVTVIGMELGLLTMRKGEFSRFLLQPRYAYGDLGCPPLVPPASRVLFEIRLVEILDLGEVEEFLQLTKEEQDAFPLSKLINVVDTVRSFGNRCFKQTHYQKAKEWYKQATVLLRSRADQSVDEKKEVRAALLPLYLNLSLVELREENPKKALKHANGALDLDATNIKALYRCAQAYVELHDYKRAHRCLVKVQAKKPFDPDVNELLKTVTLSYKDNLDKERELYGNMFPGFKSPHGRRWRAGRHGGTQAANMVPRLAFYLHLSRRTGHYSVQQNHSSLPGDGPGAENQHPRPSVCSNPGSSPRHSPKARLRPRPPCQRCNSQDSLDELQMDDYWKEVENISRSAEKGGCESGNDEEEQQKPPDEGEQEEAWLTEAGLVRLFDGSLEADQEQEEESAVFLSTLTRAQAAAVERRVTSLQQTLRRRNRQHLPDVRDIFRPPEKDKEPCEDRGGSESAPSDASSAEPETVMNVDVAFSEQALTYRDNRPRLAVQASPDSPDDKLPNFRLLRDKTGQTRVGHLSPLDMKKVRRLALVEMTALFDTAGVDLKAHKPGKLKAKESGLFGVPLVTLLEQDQRRASGTKVPFILQRLISHIEEEGLDTEGLLRIPGAATRVKSLCQELESCFYDGTFPWRQLKQHDAASLLKLFIRELPHSLLTVEYLNAFIAVNKLPTKKQQLQALNLLVLLLPEANRDSLKALVEFFQRVIEHQAKNKMSLNNVSVVMAPNIFMFKGCRSKVTEQQEFSMATGTANIVRLLIRYQNLLWTIPKFIVTQVRQQNMESQRKQNKERAVRKLLKKITTEKLPERAPPEENSQGFIRVQAPQFSKVSMAVQLTEDLQAADVLTRFLSQDSSVAVKREDLCLYEIGGNIKERCLDGETFMKDLFQLNPTAEWVIKTAQ